MNEPNEKVKPGPKPRYGQNMANVSVTLPPYTLEQVDRLARLWDCSRAHAIRVVLMDRLSENGTPESYLLDRAGI